MPISTSKCKVKDVTVDKAKESLVADLKHTGFDAVGIASAQKSADLEKKLATFLSENHHASMVWMAQTQARRANPKVLWEKAQSLVMVAMNYGPKNSSEPFQALKNKRCGTISVYAQNRDYHDVIKGKLKQVAGRFAARYKADVKVFVDTAPLMEKPHAQSAGIGWQGKHTNLVSRELGSWFFLGAIITDHQLTPDTAEIDHCGSCQACLDVCPTNAFPAPFRLDARRCISYLTIEHKGQIPDEFRKAIGNRIYGCDDCLAICPWNKFAKIASETKLLGRDDFKSPALAQLLKLDDAAFRKLFTGSPIKRIGRNRFMRNVLIAAGNSGAVDLCAHIMPHISDQNETVRGAAIWALAQILPAKQFIHLAETNASNEQAHDVQKEWQKGLESALHTDTQTQ